MLITHRSIIDEYCRAAGDQLQQQRWRTINCIRRFSWRPGDERRHVRSFVRCEDRCRRPQSHEAHVIARRWSVEMDFYSSSFLLSGVAAAAPRTQRVWMIDSACAAVARSSYRRRRRQIYARLVHSRHVDNLAGRLVFLPGLIYRGVIIRRSQRRRRHRSCITILRRALHPHRPPSQSVPLNQTASSEAILLLRPLL